MLTWCELERLVRGRMEMEIRCKGNGNSKADRDISEKDGVTGMLENSRDVLA